MQTFQSTIRQSAYFRARYSRQGAKSAPRSLSNERKTKGQLLLYGQDVPATAALVTKERCCLPCEPLLQASWPAHRSAVTDCVMLKDEGGIQEFVTSSYDKTVKFWKVEPNDIGGTVITTQTVEEGPVFALALNTCSLKPRTVLCGTQKDVVAWEAPSSKMVPREQFCCEAHSGWVRALDVEDQWLFSSSCNHLLQWDLWWPSPKLVGDIELFTGDILCIKATRGRVFVACANGSIRSWTLEQNGQMKHAAEVLNAHSNRILALEYHNGILCSAGEDGSIKSWDAKTLSPLQVVEKAHDGQKINCAAVSTDGVLYTGGNDKAIRAWRLPNFEACAEPIHHHNDAVRTLSVSETRLVSADAKGSVSLWEIGSSAPCKV